MATYTATVGARGQVTIPKPLRDLLGLTADNNKINFATNGSTITLSRERTLLESLAEIDRINEEAERRNPSIKKLRKKYAGMEYEKIRDLWESTPEGKKEFEERYGVKI